MHGGSGLVELGAWQGMEGGDVGGGGLREYGMPRREYEGRTEKGALKMEMAFIPIL